MQRQSLGSPVKLADAKDDAVLKADGNSFHSPATSAVGDCEIKPEKPLRSHSQSERFIHLIPVLVLFCFAVLYLSSHDPSSQDLAQFDGFKHREKLKDSTEIDEMEGVHHQMKGIEAFAIRNLRNLKEEIQSDDNPNANSHRKLGFF